MAPISRLSHTFSGKIMYKTRKDKRKITKYGFIGNDKIKGIEGVVRYIELSKITSKDRDEKHDFRPNSWDLT